MKRRSLPRLLPGLLFLMITAATEAWAIPVNGRVLGPGGTPFAAATVELLPLVDSFERHALELAGDSVLPAAMAKSDVKGGFHLRSPHPGMWLLSVRAAGFLPMELELFPLITPLDLPAVRLTPASPVAVRVATLTGTPLAKARVRAEPAADSVRRGDEPTGWRPAVRGAVTGPDGRAVLNRTAAEDLRLRAIAPGHLAAEVSWTSAEPIGLRLPAGRERLVEVRAPGGEAFPGVLVRSDSGWTLGRTDRHGRLVLAAPSDRETALAFEAADGHRGRGLLRCPPEGDPRKSSPAPALFTLTPPRRLAGSIFTRSQQNGLAGALVWPADDPQAWVRTGEEGHYTLVLPAGDSPSQWLVAAAVDHIPAAERVPSGHAVAVPALTLAPASSLSGRVLDRDGHPVTAVELRIAPFGAPYRPNDPLALSADDGRFSYRLLPPGQAYSLRAEAPGFAPRAVTVPELEPLVEHSDLEIVLFRGRSAHGLVLDSEEQPVAGATVRFLRAVADGAATGAFPGADALRKTETGAEGRFDLHHLAEGLYELWVEAPGFAPLTVGGLAVQPGPGSVDLGTVLLAPGASVEGLVVDSQGRGVPEVTVEVLSQSSAVKRLAMAGDPVLRTALTETDGWFRLVDLRPGETLTLRARCQGYSRVVLPGLRVPRAEPLRIVLTPSARVAGLARDETGAAVEQGHVLLLGEGIGGEVLGSAKLDEGGRFVAEDVRPGRFQVKVLAPGYLSAERSGFEVVEGEELDGIEIVLRQGAVLEGRVLDAGGQGVTGARIRLVEPAPEDGGPSFGDPPATTSEAAGRYRLAGIPEGRRTLVVEHAEYAGITVGVDARGRRRLDLRLEMGWEVAGRVVDEERRPVAGTRVLLVSPSEAREAVSDAAGRFRLTAVANGSHRLEAGKGGYARFRRPDEIRVAGADVGDLEVVLRQGGAISGQVLGLEIEELADLQIVARGPAGEQLGQLRITGEYRVDHLAAGTWNVTARLAGGGREARGHATLAATDDEVALDLEFGRGLTLDGRLMRAGEPVKNAGVALHNVDGQFTSVVVADYEGRFRAEGLTEGLYDVKVIQRGRLLHRTTLELDGDQEIVLELPLRGSGPAG